MSNTQDSTLDEDLDKILKDCVEMCAYSITCFDTDKYLTDKLWEGEGPNGYYREQIKAELSKHYLSKEEVEANYTPTKDVEKLVLEARKQELQDAFREMNKGLFRERLVYYDARMNTLNTKKEG